MLATPSGLSQSSVLPKYGEQDEEGVVFPAFEEAVGSGFEKDGAMGLDRQNDRVGENE